VINTFLQSLTVVELVLLGLFSLAVLIQLFYYWGIFGRLAFYKIPVSSNLPKPPVSVIIAARNEYYNLQEKLPAILEQDYPDFEVVVVNHTSTDDSALLLKEFQTKYPYLKVVHIEQELNFFHGKKFPLSIGIKSAANDVLLLTDADCKPMSKNWISSMLENYSPETEIVLGYGPYYREKGFLNLLIRYDTFLVAMQYFSFSLMGMTYMGVGRNLSYSRSMFFRNKGFTSHYQIASGDDDLFINQVANKHNTKIALQKDSFTYSAPKLSFNEWIQQKRRHLTTGKNYKFKFKLLLGLFSLSQLLFYFLGAVLLALGLYPWFVLAAFLLRFFTQSIVNKKILGKFQEKQLYLFSLIGELFYMLFIPLLALSTVFRKTVKWK
jgi:cellulose synthase/poly-beta-1,6-N-acetylglucosamine synthase-like glycosyltransferase